MKTKAKAALHASAAAIGLLAPGLAMAAAAGQPGSTTSSDNHATAPVGDGATADIMVTARKRTERLQDVPSSVSALSENNLQMIGAKTLADYARTVPGLYVAPSQYNGAGTPSIRGISSNTGEPTVGYYVDDTPIAVRNSTFVSGSELALFDLSRVEVLRGPQGTLYGGSSMGGTIRYITAQPSLTRFSGHVLGEIADIQGGDPNYEAAAAVGGPIIDNVLGFRASAYYRRDGGYVDRISRTTGDVTDHDINDRKTLAIRGALKFEPFSGLDITPSVFYQRQVSDDQAQYDPLYPGRKIRTVDAQPGRDHFILPSVDAQYDFSFATLTSVTSWFNRNSSQTMDYSTLLSDIYAGEPIVPGFENLNAYSQVSSRQRTFSQELRLSSRGQSKLSYVFGVFYLNDRQGFSINDHEPQADAYQEFLTGNDYATNYGALLPGQVSFLNDRSTRRRALAGFGDVTYEILRGLKLSAGVRYEHSRFDFDNVADGPLDGGRVTDNGKEIDKPVTKKFGVSYNPTRDNLIYANRTEGYRTGGVNSAVPTSICGADLAAAGRTAAPESYGPDRLKSYEIGTKNSFFDRRLIVNMALFQIYWNKIQQSIALPSCGFVYTDNVGKARSRGLEGDISFIPVRGWTLAGNFSYTDARLRENVFGGVVAATGTPAIIAMRGDQVVGVPKWTASMSSEYHYSLSAPLEAYIRLDAQYIGSSTRTAPAGRVGYDAVLYNAKDYVITSARLGVIANKSWDLSVFVKNILNSRPTIGLFALLDSTNQVTPATSLEPRTVGLTITKHFGD